MASHQPRTEEPLFKMGPRCVSCVGGTVKEKNGPGGSGDKEAVRAQQLV